MGELIEAAHLFQREPSPVERSKFWEWGKEYVDGPILNLLSIVDDMKDAPDEAAFKDSVRELVEEVSTFPELD